MEKIVFNIEPYSFTTSAFLIGILLIKELSNEEQDSVGNWLQLIGLTMQTYSSQYSTLNSTPEKDSSSDIEVIKKAIKKINDELDKL